MATVKKVQKPLLRCVFFSKGVCTLLESRPLPSVEREQAVLSCSALESRTTLDMLSVDHTEQLGHFESGR